MSNLTQYRRQSNGQWIKLSQELGKGGEATVYTIYQDSSLVAKIYHQPTVARTKKLKVMVANPPQGVSNVTGHISIAWPVDLLTDTQNQVVGFLMPKVTGMSPIFDFYNPSNRRQKYPNLDYRYLLRTARNLASAMAMLHERGYIVGDVNESNILVNEKGLVTLVDTDSFQVRDGNRVYRCEVGKPEFTPPELAGQNFKDVDRTIQHDLFGLGVVIFQLLMEGIHPFTSRFTGSGDDPYPELSQKIQAGRFPYARRSMLYKPVPFAPSFDNLHPSLQLLFTDCFQIGHDYPSSRPHAKIWQKALSQAEKNLLKCTANKQHYYFNHLQACSWCERDKQFTQKKPSPHRTPVKQPITPIKPPAKHRKLTSIFTNLLSHIQTLISKKLSTKNLFIITGLLPLPYILLGWEFAFHIPSYIASLSSVFYFSIGGGLFAIIVLLLLPILIAVIIVGYFLSIGALKLAGMVIYFILLIFGFLAFLIVHSNWYLEPLKGFLYYLIPFLYFCVAGLLSILIFSPSLITGIKFPKYGYFFVCLACYLGLSLGWQVHSSPNFAHIPSIIVPAPSLSKVEYTKLENLLKASKWQEANNETIINTGKLAPRNLFTKGELSISNIPCEDLRKIDSLWVKYSQGRFGFSVQQSIYTSLTKANSGNSNYDSYKEFGKTVGWDASAKTSSSTNTSPINLNKNFPKGHFPKDIVKEQSSYTTNIFKDCSDRK